MTFTIDGWVRNQRVELFGNDHRPELFPDELFADLFPSGRGRPSIPADVIATVMVLQALDGLSDRDAARALRDRISWKVAAGLALTDEGFDYSVLTYWRTRLRASEQPERIFDAVRAVVDATGVLKGKTRRALDSTLLDDAVATQDTVTQLISAIRRARRRDPGRRGGDGHGARLRPCGQTGDRVGRPDRQGRRWSAGSVNDALAILAALEDVTLVGEDADALGLLALVAGQDVEPGDGEGTWRIAQRVAPDRVISTVDPDARHMHKSVSEYRDGYKAHIAVEPETGLITAAAITPANAADGPTGVELLADEEPGLQVLADSAYGWRRDPRRVARRGTTTGDQGDPTPSGCARRLRPRRLHHRSRCPHGRPVPAGHTVMITTKGNAVFQRHCNSGCPLRERCTTAKDGRTIRHPRARRRTGRSPPRLARRRLRHRIPATATHGRTVHLLARRPRSPPRPLPRHRTQPARPLAPRRRDQPAPTRQPRPHPRRTNLESQPITGPGTDKEEPLHGNKPPGRPTSHPRTPALRSVMNPGPPRRYGTSTARRKRLLQQCPSAASGNVRLVGGVTPNRRPGTRKLSGSTARSGTAMDEHAARADYRIGSCVSRARALVSIQSQAEHLPATPAGGYVPTWSIRSSRAPRAGAAAFGRPARR